MNRFAPYQVSDARVGKKQLLRMSAIVSVCLLFAAFWLFDIGDLLPVKNVLPIHQVRIEGEFSQVSKEELQSYLVDRVAGGFFAVNVKQVQIDLESLPWIYKASVRRVWPDTLTVSVTEQHAVAVWNGRGLVNPLGEQFILVDSIPSDLPLLVGPEGTMATVVGYYTAISRMWEAEGIEVKKLTLDDRRAWEVQTQDGLQVYLGRRDSMAKAERFANVYRNVLADRIGSLIKVDMRYTNGFAVLPRAASRGV